MSRYHVYTSAKHPDLSSAAGHTLNFYTDSGMGTLATLYAEEVAGGELDNPYTVPVGAIIDFWTEDPSPWVVAEGDTAPVPLYINLSQSSGGPYATRVTDHGAVGDGNGDDASPSGTDDSAAINAAIAAVAAAGGGTVHVPAGVYRCTSAIGLTAGVNLVGEGPGTTWLWGPFRFCGAQNIENIKVGALGYTVSQTAACSGAHFANVQFRGGGDDAGTYVLQLGDSFNFLDGIFRDCKIERNLSTTALDNVYIDNFIGSVYPGYVEAIFDNCVFGVSNGVASGANGGSCFNVEIGCMIYDDTEPQDNYDLVFSKCVFEASDGSNISLSGFGHQEGGLGRWPYSVPFKRVIIDGCLFKGAGLLEAPTEGYAIQLEGPYQAFVGGGTKILTCRDAAIAFRGTNDPYGIHASIVSNTEIDFSRNDYGVFATPEDPYLVQVADANGIDISHCTMKVGDVPPLHRSFIRLVGLQGVHTTNDIKIHGNLFYDLSAPTTGTTTGARLIDTIDTRNTVVENNTFYTRRNESPFALFGNRSYDSVVRNNRIRSLIGKNMAGTSIAGAPVTLGDGATFRRDIVTAQFTALATSEELLASTVQPTTYAKTAGTASFLETADYDDTLLIITAAGTVAVGDVLQDAAATTELVMVLSVSTTSLRVERGYAYSALVTHAASATWNLYAKATAVTTQPSHPRSIIVTGAQAGQTAKVGVVGQTSFGGVGIDWITLNGTGNISGVLALSSVESIVLPVRQAANDELAVSSGGTLVGLPGVIAVSGDILEVSRKASAATAYTIEATGTVSVANQTVDLGSVTAGDSVMVKARLLT